MKLWKLATALVLIGALVSPTAFADEDRRGGRFVDIVVMTQNQYLGADLVPIVAAPDAVTFNFEVIKALTTIANNNLQERVEAMAETISRRQPHFVALQEVFEFNCIDPIGAGRCAAFDGAFNDHLTATTTALANQGSHYNVAAVVQNLTLPPPELGIPGIPVVLDPAAPPIFVSVIDRDVILARSDIETTVVDFGCERVSIDGCNFNTVAEAALPNPAGGDPVPLRIERGFVAVDATIKGASYRFVNTHLEVQNPSPDPLAPLLQAAQASELWSAILFNQQFGQRLIVAGDINSSPDDAPFPGPGGTTVQPPYAQLANGTDLFGGPLPYGMTDVWTQLRFNRPGYTCCQLADLSNARSMHDERIDVVFTFPAARRVFANVLDSRIWDKTESGLWPSDHGSVIAWLRY